MHLKASCDFGALGWFWGLVFKDSGFSRTSAGYDPSNDMQAASPAMSLRL